MPFVPGRAPNPSYFRGISGAKDGDSRPSTSAPKPQELPVQTGWNNSPGRPAAETVRITPAEQKRRQAALDAQSARVNAESDRRAGGAPDPSDRASLRSFSRAQLADAKPTNHQEAANLLDVMAEKGRDGMLNASELKTISDCVGLVKSMGVDPNDAQQALKNLLATQNPTTRGAETIKKLLASLG